VNKAVTDAVKNISTVDRIVEYDGRLVQKIYPIYQDDHYPRNALDFSANLHQPTKLFFGIAIDTLWFNIAVIWSMTIVLFITLYFNALKRLIRMLENKHKYKRKERS
jgi:ABC transport system ATP-binding/permease protein